MKNLSHKSRFCYKNIIMLAKIQHFLQLRGQPLESKHTHVKKNGGAPAGKTTSTVLAGGRKGLLLDGHASR